MIDFIFLEIFDFSRGKKVRGFRETLGQFLKRERESRSVSLEEMSAGTRIGLPFLEAMERDDFESIPQREFIPGFLKGYARYLGIDPEEAIRRYRIPEDLASREEDFQQVPLFPDPTPPKREVQGGQLASSRAFFGKKEMGSRWKIILQLMTLAVAIVLSLYIHHLLKDRPNREKRETPKVSVSKQGQNIEHSSPPRVPEDSGKKKVIGNR